jgi:hypothetical protein
MAALIAIGYPDEQGPGVLPIDHDSSDSIPAAAQR